MRLTFGALTLALWAAVLLPGVLGPELPERPGDSDSGASPVTSEPFTLVRSQSLDVDSRLDRIKECESGGDYRATNGRYSGAYQVSDATWDGYAGYRRSKDAPPAVQERWAREAYAIAGTRPWPYCGRT